MIEMSEDFNAGHWENRPPDPMQAQARDKLVKYFDEHPEKVFFSRQIEILNETEFFHWVTNRAIRDLEVSGKILTEVRQLGTGGTIKLLWHRSYRYHRRDAAEIVKLVEEYAHPNIGAALGIHGELMVLEGFAKNRFVMMGRNTRELGEKKWIRTEHDLDFIFERDGRGYGVEVKNMLGYMEYDEFKLKIELCKELEIVPVFAVRMLPKVWISELWREGGFALVLKYQLYPLAHKDLARRVAAELGLPVDAPRALTDGTMVRFVAWHKERL
jgi:hypothetical protein